MSGYQDTQAQELDMVELVESGERERPSIGDYGIVGDCKSAALISKGGSIDWLCWPNFSSGPVLSRLIDPENGGAWSIAPARTTSINRRYVGNTNVLEIAFETNQGGLFSPTSCPSRMKSIRVTILFRSAC